MNRRNFLKTGGLMFLGLGFGGDIRKPVAPPVQPVSFDLQAEINSVPNGGFVDVPHGINEIGNVVIPAGKYVHLRGVSPAMPGQNAQRNSSQWDWLLENFPGDFILGSVLRGTINSTAQNSRVSMTNIVMIGRGEGVAVDVGGPTGTRFTSVSFGNYEIGLRATGTYNLQIDRCDISGCDVGLSVKGGNLNRLNDINVFYCRIGADLVGECSLRGGSFQACEDGIRAVLTSGYVGDIHFEENTGTSLFIGGYGAKVDPCFFAANCGRVVIDGYCNILDIGWGVKTEFTEKSQSNLARLFGPYTDLGWNNHISTNEN